MPWIGCVHVWNGDMGGIVTKQMCFTNQMKTSWTMARTFNVFRNFIYATLHFSQWWKYKSQLEYEEWKKRPQLP